MHSVWQVGDESEWDSNVDPCLTKGVTGPLAGSGFAPSVTAAQSNSTAEEAKLEVKLIISTILHSMITFQCETSYYMKLLHFVPLVYMTELAKFQLPIYAGHYY